MASIQTLAPGVAEELRASLVINSLEQCAAELVQNSIDANASSIEVKIDVSGHSLQVSDNGDGITSADMGRVGGRYATSKCSTLQDLGRINTYGFRGEAVAAMTEMSLVDIVSCPRNQKYAYSTIFKFPVRQRYWSEASVSKLDLELERVKRTVETLALIAHRVSFTLIDMAKGTKVMSYRKADSQLSRITAILGQALSSSLTFVRSMDDDIYSLTGYLSTSGHHNRLYQFIFLNNRPIYCESLNRAINVLFQQSSFSKDGQQYDEDLRRSRERHPVYVLTLNCPPCEYDICADPSKMAVDFEDEERVLYIVRDTIITFLERHHLLSRSTASTLRSQTTTRKRKSRAKCSIGNTGNSELLGHISRVKSSLPSKTARPRQHHRENNNDVSHPEDIDIEDELEFELDTDWMAEWLEDDFISSEVDYNRQSDSRIMLPSSMSRRTSLPHANNSRARPFKTGTSGIWAQDALRKWVNPVFPTAPSHIPTLNSWNNDIATQGDSNQGQSFEKSRSRFFGTARQEGNFNVKNIRLSKLSLQRAKVIAQLDRKFILCIMDSASASVQGNGSINTTVLAVVDQHAADERVRVERLMKRMCTCSYVSETPKEISHDGSLQLPSHSLDAMDLVPPIPITLSKREWNLAKLYRDWLRRWGIVLQASASSKNGNLDPQDPFDRTPGNLGSAEDPEDIVLVSHHFSDNIGEASLEAGSGHVCSTKFTHQNEPLTIGKSVKVKENKHDLHSDYSRGWVTVLPRIIADRCVVDTTLTQDLVKDSVSWIEESRFSGEGQETLSLGSIPDGGFCY
ncbi:DNA mismatch repair protein, partial [Mortierella sp. AM989]